jgi:hypothetical protein
LKVQISEQLLTHAIVEKYHRHYLKMSLSRASHSYFSFAQGQITRQCSLGENYNETKKGKINILGRQGKEANEIPGKQQTALIQWQMEKGGRTQQELQTELSKH